MKIEEGKFYRTRDGRKAGPLWRNLMPDGFGFPWLGKVEGEPRLVSWPQSGTISSVYPSRFDLLSEWEYPPLKVDTPAPPDPRDAEIARLREALKQAREAIAYVFDGYGMEPPKWFLEEDEEADWIVVRLRPALATIDAALSRDGGSDE